MKKAPQHRMMTAEDAESRQLPEPEASPAAVRLAAEHGLDLSEIEGTGKGGKVLKSDVEAKIA
jgi:pyruvate/2-oxoglutarate dehydrogenase complex dihydrolipoamide acyltransferase (E2) component